jgi:CheY-like chemotaxis protein
MDGVEAARRIHEQAKLSRIPIIVISAYLTADVMKDAQAAGCVAVFAKPFDTYELLATISSTLKNTLIEEDDS